MVPIAQCPKCSYLRKPSDRAPAWQCPGCGVAIEKFLASQAPVAATPVVAPAPQAPRPALPFLSRLASAAPDIGSAWLFAWCWKNPLAWHPQLAMNLGQIMLMEFFVVHASIMLVGLATGDASRSSKLAAGLGVFVIYLPIAGGFAWANNALWPFLAFLWLLLSRIATAVVGRGPSEFEKRRMKYYWANGGACYILAVFAAILLPVPALGFARAKVPWSGWQIRPEEVLCWGFLYFSALAAIKLLENPRRFENADADPQ